MVYRRGIRIGQYCDILDTKMGDYSNYAHHCSVLHSSVGDRTSIGRYTMIAYAQIGKFCSISWDVMIGALEHPTHTISTHAFSYRKQFGLCEKDINIPHKKVIIENDVWIGTGAIIRSGVRIGTGAIIDAGAVVIKDVAPYEIVAGVPAKGIGYRFEKEIRTIL